MGKKAFQIDEVAVKTGLTKRALRYYEDLGLISPLRTESGYRLYSEEEIEKIVQIKEFRESLGFCLSDVKEFMQLEQNLRMFCHEPEVDPQAIEQLLETLQAQIARIETKEQSLAKIMTRYKEASVKLKQYYQSLQEGKTPLNEKN